MGSDDNNSGFLPAGYEVPKAPTKYLKMKENKKYTFRIMSKPVIGWEYWTEDQKGRKPHRVVGYDEVPEKYINPVNKKDRVKHFWAFVIWNRDDELVQIMDITQTTIQDAIKRYAQDPDWGTPVNSYDLVVEREDNNGFVEYSVTAKPPKPTEEHVEAIIDATYVDLQALYKGEDPFDDSKRDLAADFESFVNDKDQA